MRIAYTVMGYGRGHAMRVAALLPALEARHQVRIFAGRDAHAMLAFEHDSVEIPVIGYRYAATGRISARRTLTHNAARVTDLLVAGPYTRRVWQPIADFEPDLLISDSETYGHRFARHHGVPRIGLDHVGVMAYCRCRFAPGDRLAALRDRLGYRAFMGDPDRVIVSSFFDAAPRHAKVQRVGPILREAVRRARPTQGDHLLVYLNQGAYQYTPALHRVLRASAVPVIVYGTPQRGQRANIEFKAPSQHGFIDDLASARAVVCTAGHQLLAEAIHFGKPIFALPENAVEQRLNARAVVDMGLGRSAPLHALTREKLGAFLEAAPAHARRAAGHRRDGLREAHGALERAIREVTAPGRRAPGPLARLTGTG